MGARIRQQVSGRGLLSTYRITTSAGQYCLFYPDKGNVAAPGANAAQFG
jgi:hypothetical protein